MSTPTTPHKHKGEQFYLSIINTVENHSIKEVCVLLNMSKQALNYHLRKLKTLDIIERTGYGVWIVKEQNIKNLYSTASSTKNEVKITDPIRSRIKTGGLTNEIFTSLAQQPPNTIRTHALQFTVKIPPMARWRMTTRRKFLESKKVSFERRDYQCGECLFIDGCRVWLTNKSVVVWLPHMWFVKDPLTGYRCGVYELRRIIIRIESLLNVSLRIRGRHWFKPARQHHALIKNGLAEQYNAERKKLFVFDEQGLWLLIDDSEGLNELEYVACRDKTTRSCVPRETRDTKRAGMVQDFFNNLPETLQLIQGTAVGVRDLRQEFVQVKETLQVVVDIQKLQATSGVLSMNEVVDVKRRQS